MIKRNKDFTKQNRNMSFAFDWFILKKGQQNMGEIQMRTYCTLFQCPSNHYVALQDSRGIVEQLFQDKQ